MFRICFKVECVINKKGCLEIKTKLHNKNSTLPSSTPIMYEAKRRRKINIYFLNVQGVEKKSEKCVKRNFSLKVKVNRFSYLKSSIRLCSTQQSLFYLIYCQELLIGVIFQWDFNISHHIAICIHISYYIFKTLNRTTYN